MKKRPVAKKYIEKLSRFLQGFSETEWKIIQEKRAIDEHKENIRTLKKKLLKEQL